MTAKAENLLQGNDRSLNATAFASAAACEKMVPLGLKLILGEFVVESRPRDPQDFGRLPDVPLGHLEQIPNIIPLKVIQGGQMVPADKSHRSLRRHEVAKVLGKVDEVDEILLAEHRGAFQNIGEFADIPRPVVLEE